MRTRWSEKRFLQSARVGLEGLSGIEKLIANYSKIVHDPFYEVFDPLPRGFWGLNENLMYPQMISPN
jgi:hypothetical protein